MIKDVLRKFVESDLYSASLALMNEIGLRINQETREPISVSDLYDGVMPKYLQNALTLIKDIYFIGVVNDETLTKQVVNTHFQDEQEKIISNNGKYEGMFVFAMDTRSGVEIRRSDIASLTRSLNRISYAVPVILVIRDGKKVSLATCERTEFLQEWRNVSGEKLGKVSVLQNIDCQNPHRGHLDILETLGSKKVQSFDELYNHWMNVFSSELLTKKFYAELFDWYQWAVSPDANVSFPDDADVQDDDRQDIDTKIIRLITRLMFVWFIKQKGLVPSRIFDATYVSSILKDFDSQSLKVGNYYQAILQNLFFGTLNRPILEDGEKRGFAKASKIDLRNLYRYGRDEDDGLFSISDDEVIELFANVPYLNCGLFECQDKCKTLDGVKKRYYHDGFSRNPAKFKDGTYRYRAVVPNVLFFHPEKGLLSIFKRYVFTIEENTPQEVQVALDPELLGKVFENLLGAYNPETRETARNQSGSFYTPREIVQFMVNESLVAHLKATVGETLEEQYRQLLDFTTEDIDLTADQKEKIVRSIFKCKVLDPACGSGAFPMGMLQQMVHILQQVDPDNSQWREVLLNMALEESRVAFGIQDEVERTEKLREIEETFDNGLNSPDYTRKLYIIESCIYGIDIQPIAMLITRLRFFITLVSEQNDIQKDRPDINFGIKTLPNLESKFVAADSLLDADIHKYNEDWTQNEELARMKNELLAIRRRHFYTRKRGEKIRLLKEDEAVREKIHTFIKKLVGEPNMDKINRLHQEIDKLNEELKLYQGENWVEETESRQADLFDVNPQVVHISIDKNERERKRINTAIAKCKRDIELEEKKSLPQGFEAAVLQVTDWNPYDQNTVSKFLDREWMFGLTTGFDIVIGNPPYVQLQNDNGKLANRYEPCEYEVFAKTGDIYCLFYERAFQLLHKGGLLCFITSNKWMRAGYGEKVRGFLTSKTNPILLVNFAGIKIFESATVDTNVLVYRKGNNLHKVLCATTNKKDKDSIKNLSDFVKQEGSINAFNGTDAWVILSPIEQSIMQKIEAVGTPLKDWDIQINYGIKTGCNEAFIISTEKRDEILANCQSEDERRKTEELIRPILRGRDIKRYGYNWAGLYLIATFPSRHYDIEEYPAVKAYLLSYEDKRLREAGLEIIANEYLAEFCQQKLAQVGKRVEIDGQPVEINKKQEKSRKKTNNKWFETQDSISYWDLFFLPHICWKAVGRNLAFALVERGTFLTAPASFISAGEYNETILAYLASKVGTFYIYTYSDTTGAGDIMLNIQSLIKFPIPVKKEVFCNMSDAEINNKIYEAYGLTNIEISYIEEQV